MRISDWSSDVCSSDLSVRDASPEPAEGQAARPNETMEGIGAAAQDYRSVPQMPRCPSWWPDDQRNGEPCALNGASTVRGEALGRPRKGRLAPPLPRRGPGVPGGSEGLRVGKEGGGKCE